MEVQALKRHREEENYLMDPKKFMLWLFLVTVFVTFMGLTSAYIVRRAEGNWWQFPLPTTFIITSILVVLSSISMQWAYWSAKKDELSSLKTGLWLTIALGIAFCVGQFYGWKELYEQGLYLTGNTAVSFVIVISWLHLMHVLGGIVYLFIMIWSAYNFNIHARNLKQINLATTYWHFIGALWLYLYLFLSIIR